MSKEQEKFLQENYMDMTYTEISNLDMFSNLTNKQIRNRARNMGLRKSRKFNERYFENIDTPQKSYFLGLMYADGYVIKSGEVAISLMYSDREILKKLNKEIGDVHSIKERRRKNSYNGYDYESHSADLRMYSKAMKDDLDKQGIVERKTHSDIHPEVDGELFQHFLRGYFDGDGCVYKHTKQGYNMVHFTCGSRVFLEYLMKSIEKETGIIGKIYAENDRKLRLMYYREADASILLEYIYRDSDNLRLERKYDKYLYNGSPD